MLRKKQLQIKQLEEIIRALEKKDFERALTLILDLKSQLEEE